MEGTKEALNDMPPRLEEELDPVTLHNEALVHMPNDPIRGFQKLNYLLTHPPSPLETYGNVLLLLCKYRFYDLAGDLLDEAGRAPHTKVSSDLNEYLEATILSSCCPEAAYKKFDGLTNKHIDQLRKLTKAIQDARIARDNEAIKQALRDYDDGLERYIPVLMAMARIYWERLNYPMVSGVVFYAFKPRVVYKATVMPAGTGRNGFRMSGVRAQRHDVFFKEDLLCSSMQ